MILYRLALFSREILTTVPAKEQHSTFPRSLYWQPRQCSRRGAPLHTGVFIILRDHICEQPRG